MWRKSKRSMEKRRMNRRRKKIKRRRGELQQQWRRRVGRRGRGGGEWGGETIRIINGNRNTNTIRFTLSPRYIYQHTEAIAS